ncbi:MAG: ABC transporter permease [Chloroflexota bacterium]
MKKYWSILTTQVVNSLAYPGDFLGRSFSIIVFMLIFAGLWRATFAAAGTESINGLTFPNMLWYLLMCEVIELGRPRVNRVISEQVKTGEVAYILSKPYNFLGYHFFHGLGDGGVRVILNLLVGIPAVWALVGPPPPPLGWAMALTLAFGAWVLHFCMMSLIGLLAFLVEETNSFELIYQKAVFVLGGMLIPLDMFPLWLQPVAKSLPFAYMMYAPARLFVKPDLATFWQFLAVQWLWIGVLMGVLALAYQRSVKSLTVNGG